MDKRFLVMLELDYGLVQRRATVLLLYIITCVAIYFAFLLSAGVEVEEVVPSLWSSHLYGQNRPLWCAQDHDTEVCLRVTEKNGKFGTSKMIAAPLFSFHWWEGKENYCRDVYPTVTMFTRELWKKSHSLFWHLRVGSNGNWMDGEAKEGYLLNVVYGSSCQLGFPLSNLFLTAISIPLTAGLLPQVMFSLSKILLAICFVTTGPMGVLSWLN